MNNLQLVKLRLVDLATRGGRALGWHYDASMDMEKGKRRMEEPDPVVLWRRQSAAEVICTGRQHRRCKKEMRDGEKGRGERERRPRRLPAPVTCRRAAVLSLPTPPSQAHLPAAPQEAQPVRARLPRPRAPPPRRAHHGGFLVGAALPALYILDGLRPGDTTEIAAAAPHAFVLSMQVFTEGLTAAFPWRFSLPVRAAIPVMYNASRMFAAGEWLRKEMEGANAVMGREGGGAAGGWAGRGVPWRRRWRRKP